MKSGRKSRLRIAGVLALLTGEAKQVLLTSIKRRPGLTVAERELLVFLEARG